MRVTIIAVISVIVATVHSATTPDGTSKATAIPLTQRDPAKAVEEEMAWMMRRYRYTPILATRDELIRSVRELKAGKKPVHAKDDWGHGTLVYKGRLISYWWFPTPRRKAEAYFDTGTFVSTPGEVARQESARAAYLGRVIPRLKIE